MTIPDLHVELVDDDLIVRCQEPASGPPIDGKTQEWSAPIVCEVISLLRSRFGNSSISLIKRPPKARELGWISVGFGQGPTGRPLPLR